MKVEIFVDTADIEEIKEAIDSGVVDGVTTNPSLIKKAQREYEIEDMEDYISQILDVCGDLPVSLEVTETSYEGMKKEAKQLNKMFKRKGNHVVKIPVNPSDDYDNPESFEGLKLIKELSEDGIPINTTVVMSPEQAVLAAKAGADYVSPFAGRIDDYIRRTEHGRERGEDFEKWEYYPSEGRQKDDGTVAHDNGVVSGVDMVWKISQIFDTYDFDCKVLAASTRNTRQVREFMLAGADVCTMPFHVLKSLTSHYKTVEGVISFEKDTVPDYKELLEEKKRFSINFSSD